MKNALFTLALCALLSSPVFARAGEPLTLVLATDLHYIAPSLTDNGAYFTRMVQNADGKVMTHIETILDAFAHEMIRMQPDALILSGDLTFNGAKASHEALAEKLERIADAGVPVCVLPGNHDLYARNAARFHSDSYTLVDSITASGFETIYRRFGFNAAIARDEHSLSYTARIAPDLRLLLIDVNTKDAPGGVTANTLAFVRDQLAQARADGERVIAVTHQNLLQHNPLFASGFVIENREALLSLLQSADVRLSLSGHMHTQHVKHEGGLTEIATSALSVSPNQFGVLTVTAEGVSYKTQALPVAAYAAAQGINDPQLLDFPAFSETFFKQTTLRQAASLFEGAAESSLLGQYLADVNACYFSGRMDLAPQNPALFDRWKQEGAFFSTYLESIFAEPPADHTRAYIAF